MKQLPAINFAICRTAYHVVNAYDFAELCSQSNKAEVKIAVLHIKAYKKSEMFTFVNVYI